MSNERQLHTKVGRFANDQKQSMMALPARKNVRSSKVKLSPVLEKSQCSSKIMDRDIKKIESVIYQKEQPIVLSNLKISKEVTITSITDVNNDNNTENNIILKLKKLPGITIDLVKSEPVFKVPESPKLKTNNNNKKNNTSHNKEKVLFKKKGLSERRYDNVEAKDNLISHNNINISNTNLNPRILKQKSKLTFNNISLETMSSDKGIVKNLEVSYKKYPVSEKENFQRTSSPKKLSKKIQCSSKIKSKSSKTIKMVEEISHNRNIFTKEVKPAEKVSNNCNIFTKEVKTVSDNDTITNNTEFKTNDELDNENYMLMDLSTDGQFNIVPASFPLDFINVSVPEYDNFLMGISKSSKDRNMHLETSQNDTEKGSIIIKEKLDNFSDFLGCVNTSLNINESNDIHSELASQSFNNENPLENIKDNQVFINNISKKDLIGKFEDEQSYNFYFYNNTSKQPSLQHNDMNQMMDTSIIQEDNQLLQNTTRYYCDNSIENIPKNENNLMDFNIPIQQILPNNVINSSNLKSDEGENGIKRKQPQNNLFLCEKLKKQKII